MQDDKNKAVAILKKYFQDNNLDCIYDTTQDMLGYINDAFQNEDNLNFLRSIFDLKTQMFSYPCPKITVNKITSNILNYIHNIQDAPAGEIRNALQEIYNMLLDAYYTATATPKIKKIPRCAGNPIEEMVSKEEMDHLNPNNQKALRDIVLQLSQNSQYVSTQSYKEVKDDIINDFPEHIKKLNDEIKEAEDRLQYYKAMDVSEFNKGVAEKEKTILSVIKVITGLKAEKIQIAQKINEYIRDVNKTILQPIKDIAELKKVITESEKNLSDIAKNKFQTAQPIRIQSDQPDMKSRLEGLI